MRDNVCVKSCNFISLHVGELEQTKLLSASNEDQCFQEEYAVTRNTKIAGSRYTVIEAFKNGPSIHFLESDLRPSELMGWSWWHIPRNVCPEDDVAVLFSK